MKERRKGERGRKDGRKEEKKERREGRQGRSKIVISSSIKTEFHHSHLKNDFILLVLTFVKKKHAQADRRLDSASTALQL